MNVSSIAYAAGISIIKNSNINLLKPEQSGITIVQNGEFYIIYSDTETLQRCRFTIAHELGHVFLGHLLIATPKYRTFEIRNDTERAANIFARDLLAPACVLHEIRVINAADIATICNISHEAALHREKRMEELEQRNAWYTNPLERKVRQQFDDFIKSNRAK